MHTPESIAAQISQLREALGRAPTRDEFILANQMSSRTIHTHGGWDVLSTMAYEDNTLPARRGAPAVIIPGDRSERDRRAIERSTDFLITSAVNNCDADPGFLAACEQWRSYTGGKLVVNPIMYVNPTRKRDQQEGDEGITWDSRLEPYMLRHEIRPHPKLSIMPTKMQATTNNPLPAKLNGRTQNRSAIYGHPQLMMRTVPTLDLLPKVLWSSGAITAKDEEFADPLNYSNTGTGDVANFHHTHSAVIAEVRDDRIYMRQVVWDGEQFIDLDTSFQPDGVYQAPAPLALVMGDIHVGLTAPTVMEATFGPEGLYTLLGHEYLVCHDTADFKRCNRHEMGKRLSRAAMAIKGEDLISDELQMIGKFLDELPAEAKIKVVRSNHDEFIMHWLQAGEKNVDPRNLRLYHRLSDRVLGHVEEHGSFPIPLEMALQGYVDRDDLHFLDYDEPFQLGGIHLGSHGHFGANGARGTIRGFSQLGVRTVVGHGHGPGIFQGADMVGHSTVPRHGYNNGPSGWHQCHDTVHANGRRQMNLILPDGSYRG